MEDSSSLDMTRSGSIIGRFFALLIALALLCVGLPLGIHQGVAADDTPGTHPRLFRMMAYTDKVDALQDELRMDLVLQVKHGAFDPTCKGTVPAGSKDKGGACNLYFLYRFQGAWYPKSYRLATYMNTLPGPGQTGGQAAANWASNRDENYTVHSITHSGRYDYLTISIEGDIDFWNSRGDIAKDGQNPLDQVYQPGGYPQSWRVYALTSDANLNEGMPQISCGTAPWRATLVTCTNFDPSGLDPNNSTDVSIQSNDGNADSGKRYDAKVYMSDGCYKKPGATTGTYTWLCNGPRSFVGWDVNPKLWSGGQANWGLVTDYGFPNGAGIAGGSGALTQDYSPGLAPPKSFFVFWYNSKTTGNIPSSDPEYYKCSQNTSFYYQWVALKNNQWVPVTSLTPQAVRVDGQTPYYNSSGVDGATQPSSVKSGAALNEPINPATTKTNYLFAEDSSGNRMPAQRADGSIDFALAKSLQGLDGYFKLVTWPITDGMSQKKGSTTIPAPECPASHADNPLKDSAVKGITEDMSSSQVSSILDDSWSIDTAYYKYDIPRPDKPVITKVGGKDAVNSPDVSYMSTLTPTVEGTCVPSEDPSKPNKVTLFGEDPGKPIVDTGDNPNPDDPDTKGYELGTVDCKPVEAGNTAKGGTWSIVDDNTVYPVTGRNKDKGHRRYHAWLTETSTGYDMTSYFSNIAKVAFSVTQDPAPVVDSVAVPHTKRDASTGSTALPANSRVTISGTALPSYVHDPTDSGSHDSKLTVTVRPLGGPEKGQTSVLFETTEGTFAKEVSKGSAASRESEPGEQGSGVWSVSHNSETGRWDWSVSVDPQSFLKNMDGSSLSETYLVEAYLTNPGGLASDHASKETVADMTPSDAGIEQADWKQVSGSASISGHVSQPEKGAKVTVTWPGGATSETVTDMTDGSWSVPTPRGLQQGDAQVTLIDAQGNESRLFTRKLDLIPPLKNLPFTGGSMWMVGLVFALAFLAFAVALSRLRGRGLSSSRAV